MPGESREIDHNAQWLRAMRDTLGWSTTKTAEEIRRAAADARDTVELSQQTVSAFENGKHKSIPRWLGFAQIAFMREMRSRNMHDGDACQVILPEAWEKAFASKQKALGLNNPFEDLLDEPPDPSWSAKLQRYFLNREESEWLEMLRGLKPPDRAAVLQLTYSLANAADSPATHDPGDDYKGAGKQAKPLGQGREARE